MCRMCAAQGRVTPATIANHIEPVRGDFARKWHGALQSLCSTCHNSHKRGDEQRGFSTQVGLDGLPANPNHPINLVKG